MIGDPGLFEVMEGRGLLSLHDLIGRAVRVKVAVVTEDPFESGRRAALNLGHTFGHAFETLSGYRLRHGEAVSIGLVAATRLAARLDLCEPALVERVESALARLGLPVRAPGFAPEQVLAAMGTDKKRAGGRLRFVLPRAIGDVDLFGEAPEQQVLAVLAELAGPAKASALC
jgi:3-dehydroquinate synthetase